MEATMRTQLLAVSAAAAVGLAAPAAADPFLPPFSASNFGPGSASITNNYFPIRQGEIRTYTGSLGESFVMTAAGAGPTILRVRTAKVHDQAYDGDRLIEDTFDYFAQDKSGNVWYFGEDSTAYSYDKDGNLIGTSTAGSWRAGVHDGLPGFIMPMNKAVGFNYYQEFSPDDGAVDEATTLAVLPSFTIGIGTFSNVLQVLETTALEPKARDIKYYAPGVGLIAEDEDVRQNNKNPRQVFELTNTSSAPRSALEFRVVPRQKKH
jgi:hypothetical protein